MEKLLLEDIIRKYIRLNPPNARGWNSCVHIACDHGKKGPRAAFLFENNSVAFHCFNCGIKTVYDPNTSNSLPRQMEKVLTDFGIPHDEWEHIIFDNFGKPKQKTKINKNSIKLSNPKEIPLPSHFYRLCNDKWSIVARDYLKNLRAIDPDSYPFYLSTGTGSPDAARWKGRLIIPIYKDNKLIFYMGRDLTNKKPKKYLSLDIPKHNILGGFDEIFRKTNEPLYITEGWFDAYVIGGVAILGNELSKEHVAWLNRSSRKKIYIPDRFGDGKRAALLALKSGFSISTPDIGQCKDINEAVSKYGKLYVLASLSEYTASGFTARTNLEVYCKNVKEDRS